jgi:hypothetical protein
MVEARGYGSTKGVLELFFYERIYLYRSKRVEPRKLCLSSLMGWKAFYFDFGRYVNWQQKSIWKKSSLYAKGGDISIRGLKSTVGWPTLGIMDPWV